MKHIQKFNEQLENEDDIPEGNVKVKDLIEFLSTLDPEMDVVLDKDGWDYMKTGIETVEKSYLFDPDTLENLLIINN